MTALCGTDDVKRRPVLAGVTLTQAQTQALDGWIEEASLLVSGYLSDIGFTVDPDDVPDEARVVTARMVARAITQPARAADLDIFNSSMGPMGHSAHVATDALGGGVWLTKADKGILDQLVGAPGISNVAMYPPAPPRPHGSMGGLWPR